MFVPSNPNTTLFELTNVIAETLPLVVPAEKLIIPCDCKKLALAVITDEPLIPNVTLFELENTATPLVAVCVPA